MLEPAILLYGNKKIPGNMPGILNIQPGITPAV
jgi:hypothetical protein